MPATWVELRELAKGLLKDDPQEVEVRCSISRAYYSAFHAIEPICRLVPSAEAPDHGASGLGHRQVADRLTRFGGLGRGQPGFAAITMDARRHAIIYRQALQARRDADYDLDETFELESAELQLLRVQELLNFSVRAKHAIDRLAD